MAESEVLEEEERKSVDYLSSSLNTFRRISSGVYGGGMSFCSFSFFSFHDEQSYLPLHHVFAVFGEGAPMKMSEIIRV
jgi:hypothetical protein